MVIELIYKKFWVIQSNSPYFFKIVNNFFFLYFFVPQTLRLMVWFVMLKLKNGTDSFANFFKTTTSDF